MCFYLLLFTENGFQNIATGYSLSGNKTDGY